MTQTYYKAFERNTNGTMSCRDMIYEEGKTYELCGELVLCSNGFHFCREIAQVLEYYPITDCPTENIYAEVEVLGDVVWEGIPHFKGATDKLLIKRVIPDSEILNIFDRRLNTGDWNTGDWNTGHRNTGNRNTGHSNTGDWNTGHSNTGDWNTGSSNTGSSNTGSWNTGDRNTGDRNTGDRNTGDLNTGDRNTGDWNTTSFDTGFFNTIQREKVFVFNMEVDKEQFDNCNKPNFLYFTIENDKTYKECFVASYNSAGISDRVKLLNIPNFDATVFFDISGIDVTTEDWYIKSQVK